MHWLHNITSVLPVNGEPETREAAEKFIKEHGGQPAVFKDVIKAAFEDMYNDTIMIRKKRKLMKMLQPAPQN